MKLQDSIIITDLDLARLGNLKDAANLAPELDRADIVPFRAVPPDVVTMNSEVRVADLDSGSVTRYTEGISEIYEVMQALYRGLRKIVIDSPEEK